METCTSRVKRPVEPVEGEEDGKSRPQDLSSEERLTKRIQPQKRHIHFLYHLSGSSYRINIVPSVLI
jgi:hypothetical protein